MTDKDGFSPAVFRSNSEQKSPVTECFVHCVCFLFSLAKFILTMGSCVFFCSHNLSFFRTKCRECFNDVVVSALEFRCCREIPSANEKLPFDGSIKIISFITRHDDFRPVVI